LWLVPPTLANWQKTLFTELKRRAPKDPQTVWVFSSGTQSVNQLKAIGLKREAILASAEAANSFLQSTSKDVWLIAIPTYHVGGFSILARAHLSGAKVLRTAKWSAQEFLKICTDKSVTLCSLVPTQIHDLAEGGFQAPPSLRAIVVGGGALDEALYLRARKLGWPVLPSYGLTETSSQVATAPLSSLSGMEYPALEPLPHAEIELRESRIWIRAASLCHWVAKLDTQGVYTLEDPRRDGWLPTEDLARWSGSHGLRPLGRRDDVVKILGVLVPIQQVEADLRDFLRRRSLRADVAVIAAADVRAGSELVLFIETSENLKVVGRTVDDFNKKAPGPHRIRRMCWVPTLPRTALGKVKKAELRAKL
jgi:O-succinylbenzoic acid--CoA ligase